MFVGRVEALALGHALVTDVMAGRGRVLLVAGEAGIGKTALAREILGRAEAAGAVAHWGGCFEGAALLPFGVWIDCLRHPVESLSTRAATRLEQGDEVMTEIGGDAPAARRQRLRLFGDVVADVRAAAAERPQALVLEDLHWADAGSLELLAAVAAAAPGMPVLVVATYRDDELDHGGPLAGIGGGAERLTLEGLAEDDVAELLADALGRPPSADEAIRVHHQTGGNPLFVTQVARLAHGRPGAAAGVPSGLREVLGRRLARVSAWCDHVLGTAAILGPAFELPTLAAVLGQPRADVAVALEEAAMARLVVPGDDEAHGWRFVHELIRAARYDALGPQERRDGHRRATEVLAGLGGVSAGVLAHHAALAGLDENDLRPASYEVGAAGDALRRMAWDEAATLARRALRSAPPTSAGDEVRAAAWLTLGDALLRQGDDGGAAEAFAAVADLGRRTSSPVLIGRAALGFGAGLGGFEVRLLDHRQVELLEEAATALDPGSSLRPLVLARLSVALSFLGSDARRLALADEAITLARRHDDGRALAAALAARCDALAGPDHVTERLTAATEIVALAQGAGDVPLELLGRRLRVVALLERRDLSALATETAAYERAAAKVGDPFYGWYVSLWTAMRAHADGRLEEAERFVRQAAGAGAEAGSHNAPLLCSALMFFASLDAGDSERAGEEWQRILGRDPVLAEFNTAGISALVDIAAGRRDRVQATLERFGPEGLDRFTRDQEWLTNIAQVVLAATRVGHREIARRAYELLAPYEGVGVFEGIAAVDHGVADRFLALCAGCCGDAEAALRHTERALAGIAGAGRLVVAHTRADGARALLATGRESVRNRAIELAWQAIGDYEAIGLSYLAAEVRALVVAPREPAVAGGATPAATPGRLVREGDMWACTFGGTTVRLRHAKGVADLAVLLSHQGQPIHVRTLEGVDAAVAPAATDVVLDDEAIARYRRRLRDLGEDLDEAERHADRGRAERLAAERDALVDQLTSAVGLGGRRRPQAGDPDERLRKAVSARIKASIDRLEDRHPALGRHLRHSVRTGYWCCYEPEVPIEWTVVANRHR